MQYSEIGDYLDFADKEVEDDALKILAYLFSKYEYVGIGLYRVVFKMKGNLVFKFPLSASGEYCNDGEGSWFGEELAKGRLHYIKGFTCLFQEYVREVSNQEIKEVLGEVPDWVSGIDCGQVGFAKDGTTLKAFDFVHP